VREGSELTRLFHLFHKFTILLIAVIKPLGIWGAGAVALLDSSTIPLPMDLIIAGYVWNDRRRFLLYCLMAAVGSAIGGLLPFLLGRAGGELFLLKRVNRERFERLRDRFERQEFLAILIPSLMPPPTPWKLFVFGAGVFEMRTLNFMAAVFLGRLVRFSVEALLVIRYGPQIVQVAGEVIKTHRAVLFIVLAVVVGMLMFYVVRKSRGKGDPIEPDGPAGVGERNG
jgi:membrane protein YqaA with SNARE-associated domain